MIYACVNIVKNNLIHVNKTLLWSSIYQYVNVVEACERTLLYCFGYNSLKWIYEEITCICLNVPAFGHMLSGLQIDLSQYAETIMKPLGGMTCYW